MPNPVSSSGHAARREARRLLVQALYQWQLTAHGAPDLRGQFREEHPKAKVDWDYFDELLDDILVSHAQIDGLIDPLLDRPLGQIDPVEHAILMLACEELRSRLEVPYRVVINEAVNLAREFGASGSHKYINGVVDKLSASLRELEKQAS